MSETRQQQLAVIQKAAKLEDNCMIPLPLRPCDAMDQQQTKTVRKQTVIDSSRHACVTTSTG
jgi:hypothetical protein